MQVEKIEFDSSHDSQIDNNLLAFQSFSQQNNKQQHVLLEQKNQQEQYMVNSIKQSLHQANQILPAHKTISNQRQKISFKLSSLTFYKQSLTDRSNRTSFPMILQKSKQINSQKSKNIEPLAKLKEEMGEFSIFMNDKKILVYQRIKNEMINYLARNDKAKSSLSKNSMKYYCSLFVNPKLQKNKSLQQPIWQHVNQIYDLGLPNINSDLIKFQSSFQSGNLFAAFKDTSISLPTYEIYLQNDINTKGSTQWFYFKLSSNTRMKIKIKIMNFYKPTSLYQEGMKILARVQGQEAKRVGTAIKYAKNAVQGAKDSYYLQFLYQFESLTKPVYFSYFYPYNYTEDCMSYVESLQSKYYKKKIIKKQTLCKTNMGNDLIMLAISNNLLGPIKTTAKPIIYIIGRQHPGQTPSSFVLQGLINFLLSSRLQSNQLRQKFQFRIIPMVNIDGVISGNYRTNISGNDINRQWLFPSKNLHPQIYHIKQQILANKRNVLFFLDIHAHSRKMNSFFYGSNDFTKENKLYPFVCSKLNKFINYGDSSFSDDPSKSSTARVAIQKQLNIVNSLTFQISFYGWVDQMKKTRHHFKPTDLEDIGVSLALGFYYSQITLKKLQKEKPQLQLSLKSNKTPQKQKSILKNTMKIYEKWKTQLEKQFKQQNDDVSEGSSIDPEHFALEKEEMADIESQYQKLNARSDQKNGNKNQNKNQDVNFSETLFNKNLLNNQPIKVSRRYQKFNNNHIKDKKSNLYDYTLDIEEQQQTQKNSKSNLFSHSNNDFYMSSSKNFKVKQLQEQLQGKVKYISISEPENLLKNQRRMIDFKQTLRYHDKIRQMKNTFNYCLKQSKNSLIDSYQNQSNFNKLMPNFDENQVKRNFSLKSRSTKIQFQPLKSKRGLSFKQKRQFSIEKYKNLPNFRLEKV